MKGILLLSHGNMAKGMLDSLSLFFGNLENIDCLCLHQSDNPDDFKGKINQKINELDAGNGVIILGDIIGGTPLNQAAYFASDKVNVLGGMNLGLLLEIMANRENENINLDELVENAKMGIQNLNKLLGVK